MKTLIEEYGQSIFTFIVVIALLGIVIALLAVDGPVKNAFSTLITSFFEKASTFLPSGTGT